MIAYRKNLNNWTVYYVVGLCSPSKVKNILLFFSDSEGGKGPSFCCIPAPLPEKAVLDFITHCLLNVDRSGLLTICLYSHARWIKNLIAQTCYTLSLRKTSHDY